MHQLFFLTTWYYLLILLFYIQHDHIYLDNENLLKKIKWALDNINTIRNSKISKVAEKYNWKEMAKVYDQTICTNKV